MPTAPLISPATPNLLLSPKEYEARYHDQNNNVLRLYFNQLKNLNDQLVLLAQSFTDGTFGPNIKLPHVAAQHNAVQYADGDNTPTPVQWDTLDSSYEFDFDPMTGTAAPQFDGVYKIDYSLQFSNTDNAQHDAVVWLRIDGVDVPGSTTKFTIPARKTSTEWGYVCAYSTVVFEINAGQVVELVWGTDLAYDPATPSDGVYMFYETAQTTPMAYPFIPSAIGAITFVSALT